MIFSLSNGLTTVRDTAPAIPPAMKYDVIWGLRNGIATFLGSPATGSGVAVAGDGVLAGVCDVMVEARLR